MSNIVTTYCTSVQFPRIDEHLVELQKASPLASLSNEDSLDDLIHHGYMLLRLSAEEIAPIIARANEVLAG